MQPIDRGTQRMAGSCGLVPYTAWRTPNYDDVGTAAQAASVAAATCRNNRSHRRSRSSGLTRKPSMPAARQASRSSAEALAVSATIGARPFAGFDFGGADAARGFDAVDARHLHVHQHQVVGAAGAARRVPGLDRRLAVARDRRTVAEPRQQRAREQRVDLVILGDQDRQALRRCGGFAALVGSRRRRGVEFVPAASAPRARPRAPA